jgi:hypothetical protein
VKVITAALLFSAALFAQATKPADKPAEQKPIVVPVADQALLLKAQWNITRAAAGRMQAAEQYRTAEAAIKDLQGVIDREVKRVLEEAKCPNCEIDWDAQDAKGNPTLLIRPKPKASQK